MSRPSSTWRGTISSLDGANGTSCRTTTTPSRASVAVFRYRLTSLMFVSFFDGRVPCFKWARTRRKSGHSDCVDSQADLLVKGRRAEPDTMSSTLTLLTTDSSIRDMNAHIWQCGSRHSGAFLFAKSDGTFADPERWRNVTWYLETIVKNEVKRGLEENSPRHNLSMA